MAASTSSVSAVLLLGVGLLLGPGGASAWSDGIDDSVLMMQASIAHPAEFPWHVAVVIQGSSGSGMEVSDLRGSGVLISQKCVLTAASAVQQFGPRELKLDVLVGASWIYVPNGGGTAVNVQKIDSHEKFDADTFENDIAVLTLAGSILENVATPIRLPKRYYRGATYGGQILSITSWGSEEYLDVRRMYLSVTNVGVMRNKLCQKQQKDPKQFFPWTKLCVVSGSRFPCSHDGGAPVFYEEPDTGFNLVGITSGSWQCDRKDGFTTVTRVTEYLDWITAHSDAVIE